METDGCTFWPDGWPTWAGGTGHEFFACCAAHDGAGVSWKGNIDLFSCISHGGWPVMAAIMFFGVSTAGWLYRVWYRRIRRPDAL